jgi:hypothetical protein
MTLRHTLLILGSLALSCLAIHAAEKPLLLNDDRPAPLDLKGWENHSYPLGNGHFGVSFFGGIGEELWQFTEKSLHVRDPETPETYYSYIGLSSLCELRLIQDHPAEKIRDYRRELDIRNSLGSVSYEIDGTRFLRETFTSYPDRCFAARISASAPGKVSFRLKALHAYLNAYRDGTAEADGSTVILRGMTRPYGVNYEVRIAVETRGGTVRATASGPEGEFVVEGADEAVVLVTLGTNYRLDPKVFLTQKLEDKLAGFEVSSADIQQALTNAQKLGWSALRERHLADVTRLLGRADIDLGGRDPGVPTRVLLADKNRAPAAARHLEELYFQFGRYLLVSSSRQGTLPANLQGTWNMLRKAPWMAGYWANINLQMNYWPAFPTGLEETFEPYYDLFRAVFPAHQGVAKRTLEKWNRPPVEGAWSLGTSLTPFRVSNPGPTSGAGTGPFVLLSLWDWYLFTGDKAVLEKLWPFAIASSRFLVAAVKEQPDGTFLFDPSFSPENHPSKEISSLPGTAYDQQLAYENHRITLEAARLLGKTDPILPVLEKQLPHLSPVLIGTSGQLKEFRQENAYGEFGEANHRHISHLVGLFPGTLITEKKEWMDAARVSLNLRGDKSNGWAMAHRLNAWARLKDGARCHILLTTLLRHGTLPNLWDTCPPFQIDGNFGGTSGIAEMLLQSHEGFIDLLPALPAAWPAGSFSGLRARGGFSVSATWSDGWLTQASVVSEGGTDCRIKMANVTSWEVYGKDGLIIASRFHPADRILTFTTKPGEAYRLKPKTLSAK